MYDLEMTPRSETQYVRSIQESIGLSVIRLIFILVPERSISILDRFSLRFSEKEMSRISNRELPLYLWNGNKFLLDSLIQHTNNFSFAKKTFQLFPVFVIGVWITRKKYLTAN